MSKMTLEQMADELQAITDGERPRLNKTEMLEYVQDLREASERIKVDEGVVPIGYTSQAGIEHLKSWSADASAKGFGAYQDVITSVPYGNMTVPLFTHPPAQAAQVAPTPQQISDYLAALDSIRREVIEREARATTAEPVVQGENNG